MVELGVVESLSYETVRLHVKKTSSSSFKASHLPFLDSALGIRTRDLRLEREEHWEGEEVAQTPLLLPLGQKAY